MQQQQQQQRQQEQYNKQSGKERMYACHLHHDKRKALIDRSGPREGWEAFGQWHRDGDDDWDNGGNRPATSPTSPRPHSRDGGDSVRDGVNGGIGRGSGSGSASGSGRPGIERGTAATETAPAPGFDGEDERDGSPSTQRHIGTGSGGCSGVQGGEAETETVPAPVLDVDGEHERECDDVGSPASSSPIDHGGGVLGAAVVVALEGEALKPDGLGTAGAVVASACGKHKRPRVVR